MKPTGALLVGALTLTGCAATAQPETAQVPGATAADTLTCDSIAADAVAISANQGGLMLLKVRGAEITRDRRTIYTLPTGTSEDLVLACEGVGVWSDGSNNRVKLKATVDSDSEFFVAYAIVR